MTETELKKLTPKIKRIENPELKQRLLQAINYRLCDEAKAHPAYCGQCILKADCQALMMVEIYRRMYDNGK